MKIRQKNSLTKKGEEKIDSLLSSLSTIPYHKTLLRSIKHNSDMKNITKSDMDIFCLILDIYKETPKN